MMGHGPNGKRWWWVLIVCAITCLGSSAHAGAGDAAVLLAVAKRAYGLGRYDVAIQAYRQLDAIDPDPSHRFAIAQAFHQRYLVERERYALARALSGYRRYLHEGRDPAQLEAARVGVSELSPQLELESLESATTEPPPPATRFALVSEQLGARARIDDQPARPLPLFIEVAPGSHQVVFSAPGRRSVKRKLVAVRGRLVPVDIKLDPQPAKLSIRGADGASLHVDGELIGVLPLASATALEPGARFVAVTQNGYAPWAREVTLRRGHTTTLSVDLEVTGQRIAASLLMAGGAVSLAGGIVTGVLAVVEQRAARSLAQSVGGPLDATQLAEYDAHIAQRDDYRVASGTLGGVGLGVFLVGGALFILDEPDTPERPHGAHLREAPRAWTFTPVLAPGLALATLTMSL